MPNRFIIACIKLYQYLISPLLGSRCRFYPSCSQYARNAFVMHSFFKASSLTIRRLLKCHPLHEGGVDHVPD